MYYHMIRALLDQWPILTPVMIVIAGLQENHR